MNEFTYINYFLEIRFRTKNCGGGAHKIQKSSESQRERRKSRIQKNTCRNNDLNFPKVGERKPYRVNTKQDKPKENQSQISHNQILL